MMCDREVEILLQQETVEGVLTMVMQTDGVVFGCG